MPLSSRAHPRRIPRLPFAARLALALLAATAVAGACSYLLMHHRLRADAVRADARVVRADARTFERISAGVSAAEARREIAEILRATAARPGVKEALVIDAGFRVVAGGHADDAGRRVRDAELERALTHGRAYAGGEADARGDSGDLEYIEPLMLGGRPHAYEVTRSSAHLDAQLATADRTELEVALLGLALGTLVFLPLGGRLVREHRLALENATLDGLTRLPNHRAFAAELRAAAGRAYRHGEQLSLVALDVDDFKFVNDRHGHRHGDELLRGVAAVLGGDARAGDRAFRTGGDEFVLLLPRTAEAGAQTVTAKLLEGLEARGIRASAGVAALRPGEDHVALHQQADAALYEAKRRGGHQVATFGEIADETSVTSAEAGLALRTLIDLGDVECAFQPIWDLREGRLLAVEALARIPAGYGFDGPAEAFDVAQRIGRVRDLDVLCATEALRRAGRELPGGVLLFLNLAPQTLDRDLRGGDWLRDAIAAAGLPLDRVVVEVTERVGARGAAVAAAIERLRGHGLRIAIDHVGSGAGGLEMLRRTQPDYVKVDRSVVAAAGADMSARGVLLAVAAFATQTGAFVIAEGIEDDAALALVKDLGDRLGDGVRVDGGQGFGLGRPDPELPAARTPPAAVLVA
jgi:diguanylate cyclase (GGDEF)-like protein